MDTHGGCEGSPSHTTVSDGKEDLNLPMSRTLHTNKAITTCVLLVTFSWLHTQVNTTAYHMWLHAMYYTYVSAHIYIQVKYSLVLVHTYTCESSRTYIHVWTHRHLQHSHTYTSTVDNVLFLKSYSWVYEYISKWLMQYNSMYIGRWKRSDRRLIYTPIMTMTGEVCKICKHSWSFAPWFSWSFAP